MKKKIPNKFILIEGIDGSGKDTFTDFLMDELKNLFYKTETRSISKVGQPFSELDSGTEAKRFIEDFVEYQDYQTISKILKSNRLACEKYYHQYQGLIICIRGLLTDIATLHRAFPLQTELDVHGQRSIDMLIVIDIDTDTADLRIERRGIPRTWRESKSELTYFRNYYLNYENDLIKKKVIITASNKEHLSSVAKKIARDLYDAA